MQAQGFIGRAALQQRVLPAYRVPFFELLGQACSEGLSVFAGEPRPREAILSASGLDDVDLARGGNIHLFSGPAYMCYQTGMLGWLKRWSPDVLIMEANPRYLSSRSGVGWMHRQGRPVIGWGLGAAGQGSAIAGFRSVIRGRFMSHFDAVIAYSEQGAEEFRALGIKPEQVFVAGNAVSGSPPAPPSRGSPQGRPARILYVGRLQARKRVDVLLEACAQLSRPVEVRVVGDGPERARLERLAGNVFPGTDFPGALHGEALQDSFAWADLFVLPGTGGLAVQEAMATGLPVIVAEGDGTERDLISADNGWLVPVNDPRALHRTIEEALRDPARLADMGKRSHALVRDRFNIERMTAVFVQAMNQVLER